MQEQDINILKCFNCLNEPEFIYKLNLRYDMDYYYGIINQILNNYKNLNCSLSEFSPKTKKNIDDYMNLSNNSDDKIFFCLMQTVDNIFYKYFNMDGTRK